MFLVEGGQPVGPLIRDGPVLSSSRSKESNRTGSNKQLIPSLPSDELPLAMTCFFLLAEQAKGASFKTRVLSMLPVYHLKGGMSVERRDRVFLPPEERSISSVRFIRFRLTPLVGACPA